MLEGELGTVSVGAAGSFLLSVDVTLEAERSAQVWVNELSDVGEESEGGSVVGESGSEVGAWVPVDTDLLGSSDRASTLSGVQGSGESELLVEVPEKTDVPSADSTGSDTVDLETSLSLGASVADDEVSVVLVLSSKTELGKESEDPVVLLESPVFLDVDSSVSEVKVEVQGAWNSLAVEFGNGTDSSLSGGVQVLVSGWDVKDHVRVEGVALQVLFWVKIRIWAKIRTWVPKSKCPVIFPGLNLKKDGFPLLVLKSIWASTLEDGSNLAPNPGLTFYFGVRMGSFKG